MNYKIPLKSPFEVMAVSRPHVVSKEVSETPSFRAARLVLVKKKGSTINVKRHLSSMAKLESRKVNLLIEDSNILRLKTNFSSQNF